MKKKLTAIAFACVLALALPCMAFATDSENENQDTTPSVAINENGDKVKLNDANGKTKLEFTAAGAEWVKVEESDKIADNFNEDLIEGEIRSVESFRITASDNVDENDVVVTLVYYTDPSLADHACYVFVQHEGSKANESFIVPVGKDGKVELQFRGLSWVTFAVSDALYSDVVKDADTEKASTSKGGASSVKTAAVDNGSTSPKTGVVA